MDHLETLETAIKAGKRKDAVAATQAALDAEVGADAILGALVAGMDDVGRRFKAGEVFVPEVLVAARAMKQSMELLEPELVKAGITPKYTAVVGTVQGDLHDIGKNLVAMMWRGANFKVIDLGTNVEPDAYIAAAREHDADIVGLSALLTTTMPSMRETTQALKASGIRAKVLIGGAPITDAFAEEIGADGFAPDAASAVDLARRLVGAA